MMKDVDAMSMPIYEDSLIPGEIYTFAKDMLFYFLVYYNNKYTDCEKLQNKNFIYLESKKVPVTTNYFHHFFLCEGKILVLKQSDLAYIIRITY